MQIPGTNTIPDTNQVDDVKNKWLSEQAEGLMDLKPLQEFENVVKNQHRKIIINKGLHYTGVGTNPVIYVNKIIMDNKKWMRKLPCFKCAKPSNIHSGLKKSKLSAVPWKDVRKPITLQHMRT